MSAKETSLVIVESPSKARTIKKYLGKNFEVEASVGHVIDLPKSKFGVSIEEGFKPQYIKIRGKEKIIKQLNTHAKKVSKVYLATDPDREGEAIAYHIASILNKQKEDILRIEFNEITRNAVTKAIDLDSFKTRDSMNQFFLNRLRQTGRKTIRVILITA